jgi:segregation and condensation protein A
MDRKVVRLVPQVTLHEMLLAFREVVVRNEMFAHHHVQRERLSVRERMTDIVARLANASFLEFMQLFRPEEGRMGVAVTFIAILELVREGLIDIVQQEPFAPLHVRAATAARKLRVVAEDSGAEDSGEQDVPQAQVMPVADDDFDDDDEDDDEADPGVELQ